MKAPAYSPPAHFPGVDLDLSRNEGKRPDPELVESGFASAEIADLIRRYPDTTALRGRLAERLGVDQERVLVTAGADDALFRCFLAKLGPGLGAVTTRPTFEMITIYASQVGAELVEIDWWDDPFPISEVTKAAAGAKAVFVVSPNNPTGSVLSAADLMEVAHASEFVVLDSAYAEFADQDLTAVAAELANVVVVRTLSKAFGLAGLRVGYLLGPSDLVEEISSFGSPYSVSAVSAAIAYQALDKADLSAARFVDRIRSERNDLRSHLDSLGARTLPSQGNFVLARVDDARRVTEACAALGVGIRRFPDRIELEGWIRVTLPGDRDDFARLKRTLTAALADRLDISGAIDQEEPSQ